MQIQGQILSFEGACLQTKIEFLVVSVLLFYLFFCSLSLRRKAKDILGTFSSPTNSWIQKLVVAGIFQFNENN